MVTYFNFIEPDLQETHNTCIQGAYSTDVFLSFELVRKTRLIALEEQLPRSTVRK